MKNTNHWDYAEEFSGRDAALLIAGFDPSTQSAENAYSIRPIVARMKKSYYRTVSVLVEEIISGAGFYADETREDFANVNALKRRKPDGDDLWSVEIEKLVDDYNERYLSAGIPDDFEFCNTDEHELPVAEVKRRIRATIDSYFTDERERIKEMESEVGRPIRSWAYDYIHEFDDQKFSRTEIRRWLDATNMPADYKFEAANTILREVQVFPWGKHTTILLEQLSLAAAKFWNLYDPTDISTAPTNEQVTEWLIKQGVGKRVAECMATILRADGIPSGKRRR